jgi:hypothetical protein
MSRLRVLVLYWPGNEKVQLVFCLIGCGYFARAGTWKEFVWIAVMMAYPP